MKLDALPIIPNNQMANTSIQEKDRPQANDETKKQTAVGVIKKKQIDRSKIEDAVDKMNKASRIFNRSFHFRLHEKSHRWQVQVIDTDSGKIIREIPPTEVLDVVAKIGEMVGVLVDERR